MDEYVVTVKGADGVMRDFKLYGGPLDDPERPTELFEALGFAACAWARMEQHLDTILIHVNKSEYSEKLYTERHPVMISGKIKLFKRWFNQHPALAGMAGMARLLTSGIKQISGNRHTFIHAALEAWDPETKTAKFHGIKFDGDDSFLAETFDVHLDFIIRFGKHVNQANELLADISKRLFTEDAARLLRTLS
jgi:hypothetical protein